VQEQNQKLHQTMSDDQQKLEELCHKNYKAQAIWFLNAFWAQLTSDQREKVWAYKYKFDDLDLEKKKEGSELDELNAHRFLEAFKDPLTVREMREKLRAKGALKEKGVSKFVPLTHFLTVHFDADFHTLVNAPQGNAEEVAEAQRRLEEVNEALRQCELRAAEARAALKAAQAAAVEAKKREDAARAAEVDAKKRETDALSAEAQAKAQEASAKRAEEEARHLEKEAVARAEDSKAAQRELEEALAVVKREEDAYNGRTAELQKASEEGGLVSRNKAKNELAQHLAEDPLPLRRAKITAEAAVKRAEKAAKLAEASARDAGEARHAAEEASKKATKARAEAEAAAAQATQARQRAEEAAAQATKARGLAEEAERASAAAKEAADAQVEATRVKFAEAEAYLEKVKASIGQGALWWLERELFEAKKYMPTSKGGIARK